MKEGKGVTREMTQKFTLESQANIKSLDEINYKGLERSNNDDSRNIRTEKYSSEARCKIEKRNKKKEAKNNVSMYSKHNKRRSKEKDNENEKEKDINKKNKSKVKSKDKDRRKSSK